jgi:erythrocyte band 7 integral membrane protein
MDAATDDSAPKSTTPLNNGAKPGPSSFNGGFRPHHNAAANGSVPMVNVEPARREDLQPSYAGILVGDNDAGSNGWYGGMSMSCLP